MSKEQTRKLESVARLWVRWNAKMIDGNTFGADIQRLLPKETKRAWNNYVKPMQAEDPLRALLI